MDRSFTCTIETDFGELSKHSVRWSELHSLSDQSEVFQSFAWIRAWWESFGGGRLFTPVVAADSRVVGILPLWLDGRRLRFIAHSVSDYAHVLAAPDDAPRVMQQCLAALDAQSSQWDEIVLDNVPESSSLARCIRQLSAEWPGRVVERPGEPCPTLLLRQDKQQTLDGLLAKDKLKKAVRYLARRGPLTFQHIEDAAGLAAHLPEFARQHARRSVFAGRRSAFLDHAYLDFYKKLCERLDLRSELRFSVLKMGDRPVAYHFGTLWRAKYLFYKPTFDVDLWELSPGQVLLWYLFEHLKSDAAEEFDFGQGGETYKFRFANHVRRNLNFKVYPPGFRGRRGQSLFRAREAAKDAVKKSPPLSRLANAFRDLHTDVSVAYRRTGTVGAAANLWSRFVPSSEEWWLLQAPAPDAVADSVAGGFHAVTLAGLADLAVASPDALDDQMLHAARKLLQQGSTAWVADDDLGPVAILWTTSGAKLPTPVREIELPEKSLALEDVWPLTERGQDELAAACLRFILTAARGTDLPVYAFLPRRRLPKTARLRALGFEPKAKFLRSRALGRTTWREKPGKHSAAL